MTIPTPEKTLGSASRFSDTGPRILNERLIKAIDSTIAKALVSMLDALRFKPREYTPADLADYTRFLIIRPGGMGDAALLLPLIRALRARSKNVSIVCNARNFSICQIFFAHGLVDEVFLLESLADVRRCRELTFDCVLDTEQSFYSSALIGAFIRPRLMIGFDSNARRCLYDYFVRYRQEEYEAQSFLNLLRPFGVSLEFESGALRLTEAESATPRESLLLVFGGAHTPARMLPVALLQRTLQRVQHAFSSIVAIGGVSEEAHADAFLAGLTNTKNLCGKTSVAETLAIMRRARAFLGADSGPLHLASLAGTPRICGVFGPGIDHKWGTPGIVRVVTAEGPPCRPCNYGRFSQTPLCPYGAACLTGISPDTLIAALLEPHESASAPE